MSQVPQERERLILEQIALNPHLTQAELAEVLGVAVGTINFAVQRLIKKGYLRAKQLQRRRLQYILTPSGIAFRAKLAVDSLNYSLRLYRDIRAQARQLLTEVQRRGHKEIYIAGTGDLADIARLTCLEMGLVVRNDQTAPISLQANTKLELIFSTENQGTCSSE